MHIPNRSNLKFGIKRITKASRILAAILHSTKHKIKRVPDQFSNTSSETENSGPSQEFTGRSYRKNECLIS